jgi:predicted MPP superfamily phosphohydrolase
MTTNDSKKSIIRLCHTSDTHIGLTKPKTILKMLKKMKQNDIDGKTPFDLFLHSGDYCGGTNGARSVETTVKMFREVFPDKPYITNIGNHDYWTVPDRAKRSVGARPSSAEFLENLEKITETFRNYKVHFLDEEGPFRMNGWTFVGHTGWYAAAQPQTNDIKYLPIGLGGDTHAWLSKASINDLDKNLSLLEQRDVNVAFCSHFPVVRAESDVFFDRFSGFEYISQHLQAEFKCKYFFCGHAHQSHDGPLRYECGSDYGSPKYKVLTLTGVE